MVTTWRTGRARQRDPARSVSKDEPLKQDHLAAALRVLVVSEVRLIQEGVAQALARRGRMTVIGSADLSQAQARALELRPDIILFDATRRSRTQHAKHLAAAATEAKIVAFGVAESDSEILALAAAGIAGYVREDAAVDDVATVLDGVMRNELVCSPRAAASLYHQVARLSQTGRADPSDPALSRREIQIAHLIERGLSNKEIARELGIEATTVKNHVHNILDKLKVHRRGEAAARIRMALMPRAPPAAPAPISGLDT